MAYTLITGNNTKFTANVQWNFTTSAATRSNIYLQAKNNSALTFQATVTNPTTGTFNILNIKGRRTDSNSSYQNVNSAWINIKFDNASSWTTNNKCNIYFNTKSTSWASAPNWTKAGSTFTFQQTSVAVGTGKYLNIKTQGTQATINKQFNTTVNCGVGTTRTYSKDNSTFQSSATFTGLTPNTLYTIYMKTLTNAGGVSGTHTTYDSRSMRTPCNPPSNLKLSLTDDHCLYGYVLKASADGDTNAPITNITVYARKAGTIPFTHSATADSNGQVVIMTGSEPWQEMECLMSATNAGGTTYLMSIPQEYQEYQYLLTTGAQALNTGYQFGCNSAIHCHFKFNDAPDAQTAIFGNVEGSNTGASGFSACFYANSELGMSWYCQNGYGTYNATSSYYDTLLHDYIIDSYYNDNAGRYAIGNMVGSTMPTAQARTFEHSARNLMLCCLNNFGTPASFAKGYYYQACILEEDVPVALFIPAVRRSDNVAGMYDPVRKQFYTSYTSTAFNVPSANMKATTLSTTFWTANPAVWVKTENGWQKRKCLYYKDSIDSWERAGAYNPEVGMGVKRKIRPTSTAGIQFVPLEYLQSDGFTNYFTMGRTAAAWWGCKIKASISERQSTSGPHLVSDASERLWIVPRADQLLVDYCKSSSWDSWTPTLDRPFIITLRTDKGALWVEDGGNTYSILFNGGKLEQTSASIYFLNYGGDYTSGNYGFKGKIYYIIWYENGNIKRYLIPVKITQSNSTAHPVGEICFYDIKGLSYYSISGDGGVSAGPEITDDTGNWWEAYDH